MMLNRASLQRFLLVLAVAACGGESTEPPRPAQVTAINPVHQGVVGTELTTALTAHVKDGNGRSVAGITVTWTASAGTLSASTATTDAGGYAEVRWTLGTLAGPQQVVASVSGLAPATFTATALPGPPVSVTVTPSSPRVEPRAAIQFSAQLGPDQYGNAWPITSVVWSSSDTAVAPVTGAGQVTAMRAGTARVRATVGGVTGESSIEVTARWRAIGAGRMHTCALDEVGYAFCWGDNSFDQLGALNTSRDSVPIPVIGDRRYTALAVGNSHACGLTSEHEAYCWGGNGVGQLGIGTIATSSSATPARVIGGPSFASISTTGLHTCGLTALGVASCWGWQGEGALGNGSTAVAGQPTPVPVHGGLTFRAISGGGSHTCAITPENAPYCWGNDYEGQIGDATVVMPGYRPVPTAVIGGLVVDRIAAGGAHTCARAMDGRILCWGSSESGQVGDGTYTPHPTPTAPTNSSSFTTVEPGYRHTCALTAEGDTWCWGRNTDGQLGDASTLTKAVPSRVDTPTRFTSLSAGWAHTCGVTRDGEAYCWGAGPSGELGTGTREARTFPTRVSSPR